MKSSNPPLSRNMKKCAPPLKQGGMKPWNPWVRSSSYNWLERFNLNMLTQILIKNQFLPLLLPKGNSQFEEISLRYVLVNNFKWSSSSVWMERFNLNKLTQILIKNQFLPLLLPKGNSQFEKISLRYVLVNNFKWSSSFVWLGHLTSIF